MGREVGRGVRVLGVEKGREGRRKGLLLGTVSGYRVHSWIVVEES